MSIFLALLTLATEDKVECATGLRKVTGVARHHSRDRLLSSALQGHYSTELAWLSLGIAAGPLPLLASLSIIAIDGSVLRAKFS